MKIRLFDHLTFHALSGTFNELNKVGNRLFFRNQLINHNGADEMALVRKSRFMGFIQREVMEISILLTNGHILRSPIHTGSRSRVSSYKEIMNQIKELEFKARRLGTDIKRATISHTHMSKCEVSESHLRLNPVSDADMRVVSRLKEFRKYEIEIKAITKYGLNFSMLF